MIIYCNFIKKKLIVLKILQYIFPIKDTSVIF